LREVKDKHMTAQERFTRMTDIHIHSGLDGAHQVNSLIKPTRFFHKAICKLKYYCILLSATKSNLTALTHHDTVIRIVPKFGYKDF
jgi:hypothetical protein